MKHKRKKRKKTGHVKNRPIAAGGLYFNINVPGVVWKTVTPISEVNIQRPSGRTFDVTSWGDDPLTPPPMEE